MFVLWDEESYGRAPLVCFVTLASTGETNFYPTMLLLFQQKPADRSAGSPAIQVALC
jgi:hypothetical protein